MKIKRGQVSLFIILGIIVFVIIMFFLMARGKGFGGGDRGAGIAEGEGEAAAASSLAGFIKACAEKTAKEAVIYTGLRGGVAPVALGYSKDFSQNYLEFKDVPVHYDFESGTDQTPTDNDIKLTLEYYMNKALPKCTQEFESFTQQGFEVDEGDVTSTATIGLKDVYFDITYPVSITREDVTESVEDTTVQVRVMLPKMIKTTRNYIDAQIDNPDYFRMGDLIEVTKDDSLNIEFEVFDQGHGDIVVSLIDKEIEIDNIYYVWEFALKYDWPSPPAP
ncbi:hypothetical protein ACFL96_06690 [Thermoproteota archaeon]